MASEHMDLGTGEGEEQGCRISSWKVGRVGGGGGPPWSVVSFSNLLCEWGWGRRGRGAHMLGIPSSGWASPLQTFRMWETEDKGGWIANLSGYSV